MYASDYSILVTLGSDSVVQIQASVPVSGVVDEGEIRYYEFEVLSKSDTLKVQLQPFAGNPNLYISASGYPD